MSGGTWNYQQDRLREFLTGRLLNERESDLVTDCPQLAETFEQLGNTLADIIHDLDWHYAADSQIDDMAAFERQALEKLREAIGRD